MLERVRPRLEPAPALTDTGLVVPANEPPLATPRDCASLDATRLRRADLDVTADRLERAWAAEIRVLALDRDDREGSLRVMEDWSPPELGDLRATILQQAVWRQGEGL